MNALEKTEKELEFEKRRLKQAGGEVLQWLEHTPAGKFASENPWLVAGIAAGLGLVVGQWIASRNSRRD